MLSAFDLVAILLVLTAAFGWINHCFIRLPHTIGLLVMGLAASLLLIGVKLAFPDILLYEHLAGVVRQIDFQATVLNGMLSAKPSQAMWQTVSWSAFVVMVETRTQTSIQC